MEKQHGMANRYPHFKARTTAIPKLNEDGEVSSYLILPFSKNKKKKALNVTGLSITFFQKMDCTNTNYLVGRCPPWHQVTSALRYWWDAQREVRVQAFLQ